MATWHSVLGAMSKARRGEEAESLFLRLLESGETPDACSVNLVLKAWQGNWQRASGVMRSVTASLKQARPPHERRRRVLDVSTYSSVARACGDGGAFEEARHWIAEGRLQLSDGLHIPSGRVNGLGPTGTDEAAADNAGLLPESDDRCLRDLDEGIYRKWSRGRLFELRDMLAAECGGSSSSGGGSSAPCYENNSTPLAAVDREATAQLFEDLGEAADSGSMPSFQHAGARSGYMVHKLVSRSSRFSDFLIALDHSASAGDENANEYWTLVSERGASTPGPPAKASRQQAATGAPPPLSPLRREESHSPPEARKSVWSASTWLRGPVGEFVCAAQQRGTPLRLLSVGGGPGFDLVGAALLVDYFQLVGSSASRGGGGGGGEGGGCVAEHREGSNGCVNGRQQAWRGGGGAGVHATVLDYEGGWRDCVAGVEGALNAQTAPAGAPAEGSEEQQVGAATEGAFDGGRRHQATFGLCDITAPLDSLSNAAVVSHLESSNAAKEPVLFAASYVVAENAVALRRSGFRFFAECASAAPPGSLFVLTETTHRLWPELLHAMLSGGEEQENAVKEAGEFGNRGAPQEGSAHSQRSRASTSAANLSPSAFEVHFLRLRGRRGVALALQKRSAHIQSGGGLRRNGESSSVGEMLRAFESDRVKHEARLRRQLEDHEAAVRAQAAHAEGREARKRQLHANKARRKQRKKP